MAANRAAYILLKLIKDGKIKDNEALLGFSYDLIELSSEQGVFSPDDRVSFGLTEDNSRPH